MYMRSGENKYCPLNFMVGIKVSIAECHPRKSRSGEIKMLCQGTFSVTL